MPSAVHVYPFEPWGIHGGTMRLAFAVAATAAAGFDTSVMCWIDGQWTRVPADSVTSKPPAQPSPGRRQPRQVERLKRSLFPSTLWESARGARSSAPPLPPGAAVVLHTSYLAPMASSMRAAGHYVAVDAYDLIWRVHEVDATLARGPRAFARRTYARSVRPRELRGLHSANALLAAGWTDAHDLAMATKRRVEWAPTGLAVNEIPKQPSERLRVGLLGNFSHSATTAAADELLKSPLARAANVEIVFAGLQSEAWDGREGAKGLGAVASIDEFYRAVDATVVPVTNPSGMKTKLAEAVLAGRPVVTTRDGAIGYPPHLQAHFTVLELHALTEARIAEAATGESAGAARAAFEAELGWDSALVTYRTALGSPFGSHTGV